jgi:DNA-binding CsgD family transcriptional regulator
MSQSALLRVEDVRAIVRLVGECRDLGDDPDAWQQHLFQSAARLIGASVVTAGDMIGRSGQPAYVTPLSVWGWGNKVSQETWLAWVLPFKDDPTFSQGVMRYMEHFREEDGVARSRTDLLSGREWEGSAEHQSCRMMGVDHMMGCFRMFSGAKDAFRALCVWRAPGERDFTRRERVLLREVQAATVPLMGGPLARPGEPSPADLPPRVRQVLRCLLEGDGDKQIAARLGLTRHTVNQYAKAIFRHFGVESRAELLARWVRRGFPARFSWEDE